MDKHKFSQLPAFQATATANKLGCPPTDQDLHQVRLAASGRTLLSGVDLACGHATCAGLQPKIRTRWTDFTYPLDGPEHYQEMLSALTLDQARNDLIAGDVKNELVRKAGACLVVSDRIAHLEALGGSLLRLGLEMALLSGRTPIGLREATVGQVQTGKITILGCTAQLLGEGFDCPGLSSLFLAAPIKLQGKLLQALGRILRPQAGQVPTLYDYKDPIDVLIAASRPRAEAYGRYTSRVFSQAEQARKTVSQMGGLMPVRLSPEGCNG